MNLQAEDKSNKALTVGSLNVLGGIKSDELTSIHTHLQTQDGVQSRIIADMEKLYQSISADGVITANEKQMLKKELTIIETEYPIILAKAETAKKSKADIEKYKEAFQKLYHYIYSELKVFDSMQTPLDIERTTFNAIFAAYYSSRALLQITQDGTTKFLPSLEIPGDYENQIGTFQGRLYRWTDGKWELLNAVMPLNPVAHYDMADVTKTEVLTKEQQAYTRTLISPVDFSFRHEYFSDFISKLTVGTRYTFSADFKVLEGSPEYATLIFYNYTTNKRIAMSHTPVKNGFCRAKLEFTYQQIKNNDLQLIFYSGEVGKTNGIKSWWHNFSITKNNLILDSSGNNNHATISGNTIKTNDIKVGQALVFNTGCLTRPPQDFIGVGEQWSHSRWVKIDEYNKEEHTYLYSYGYYDWFAFKDQAISTKGKRTYCSLQADVQKLVGKWVHIVVQTKLTKTSCKKELYINSKLAAYKEVEGDFSEVEQQQNTDMTYGSGYVNGSLANLIFFDRLLTEQEVLYLYLNPQYPVKNYTIADWAIDPANPESSIKNLTPKYLGVTETVPTTRTVVIMKGDKLGAQDAHAGDWVLMAKTVGGWKCGVCYRWTGSMWINLEPEYNYTEQYQAALYHICEISELMQNTGHFGALFAKVLVAQQAFIDKLVVNQALIEKLIVQKLHIDSDDKSDQDFEADINEDVGISVRYKNTPVFEVSKNGRALFSGDIKTPSFELKQGDIKSYDLDFSGQCVAETVPNEIFKSEKKLPFIGYIKCSGTFGNKNIVAVASYIQDGTKTYNNVIVRNSRREHGVSSYYIGDATYAIKVYNILVYYSDNTIAKVQDTIVQGTCIDKIERQSFEYILNHDTEDKYNVFSPPDDDRKPKMKISALKIKINDNATTMKVINLPNGDGSYESGSIYVENGFLKVHL